MRGQLLSKGLSGHCLAFGSSSGIDVNHNVIWLGQSVSSLFSDDSNHVGIVLHIYFTLLFILNCLMYL